MIFWQETFGLRCHEHRRAKRLNEAADRFHIRLRVKIQTEKHHRPLRLVKMLHHSVDGFSRSWSNRLWHEGNTQRICVLPIWFATDITWQPNVHRSHTRFKRAAEGLAHLCRGVFPIQRDGHLCKWTVHGIQVKILMRCVGLCRRRGRCRDGNHGCAIKKGVRHPKCHIHGPWSQSRDTHTGPALHLTGGICHQGCGRFVARQEKLNPDLASRFNKIEDLATW